MPVAELVEFFYTSIDFTALSRLKPFFSKDILFWHGVCYLISPLTYKVLDDTKMINRLLLLIAAVAVCSPVYATVIQDNYWGGDGHGYGDVIAGSGDTRFDISKMDVSLTGTQLSVTIYTNFGAGNGLDSYQSYTLGGKGIGFGDLLLSSNGWNPYGSSSNNYKYDNAANGTLWNYGVSLRDRWSATSTAASLYALNTTTGNSDVLLTDHYITGNAIFRSGQATAVDMSKASQLANIASFDASQSGDNGHVTYVVDLAGTALANASSIGLHWNMTCGNDTIEGQYSVPVPEPASFFIMLLGVGVFGLGVVGHRRRVSVA